MDRFLKLAFFQLMVVKYKYFILKLKTAFFSHFNNLLQK